MHPPPLHLVQPCQIFSLRRDDHLSRNELGFGIVLRRLLGHVKRRLRARNSRRVPGLSDRAAITEASEQALM